VERGVYGGIYSIGSPKSKQMNSEVIAGFAGIKIGDSVFLYVKNVGLYGLWKVTCEPFYDDKSLWNDPICVPTKSLSDPYLSEVPRPLPMQLDCDQKGHLIYEAYLNAWFMQAFAHGRLRGLIGDYSDFINYVPTSFNKIMDIFLI
jgi:hypothetical protein